MVAYTKEGAFDVALELSKGSKLSGACSPRGNAGRAGGGDARREHPDEGGGGRCRLAVPAAPRGEHPAMAGDVPLHDPEGAGCGPVRRGSCAAQRKGRRKKEVNEELWHEDTPDSPERWVTVTGRQSHAL